MTAFEESQRAGKTSDRSGSAQGDGHGSSPSLASAGIAPQDPLDNVDTDLNELDWLFLVTEVRKI